MRKASLKISSLHVRLVVRLMGACGILVVGVFGVISLFRSFGSIAHCDTRCGRCFFRHPPSIVIQAGSIVAQTPPVSRNHRCASSANVAQHRRANVLNHKMSKKPGIPTNVAQKPPMLRKVFKSRPSVEIAVRGQETRRTTASNTSELLHQIL